MNAHAQATESATNTKRCRSQATSANRRTCVIPANATAKAMSIKAGAPGANAAQATNVRICGAKNANARMTPAP